MMLRPTLDTLLVDVGAPVRSPVRDTSRALAELLSAWKRPMKSADGNSAFQRFLTGPRRDAIRLVVGSAGHGIDAPFLFQPLSEHPHAVLGT
jgi:hypothetical protein